MIMTMRAVVLTLGWFAAVNAGASLLAWVLTGPTSSRPQARTPRRLIPLRLFPACASMLFAGGMFLPSHLLFEPRDANETLGLLWYGLSMAGAFLLVRSALRAGEVWRRGRQLRRVEHRADPELAGARQVEGFSGVSLAGVISPRILIGPDVVRELTPAELDVAIAHELAHRDAFDNLVRWAMLCAPDFFGHSARARRLEDDWHEAAESLADADAVRGDPMRAVHLASALVKVARLAARAPSATAIPAWSTLNDPPLLERRVRCLLSGVLPPLVPRVRRLPVALTLVAAGLAGAVPAAPSIHRITEQLVSLLP
jgi:beta-lactamase regulating signal transducer with metallopeptidase domain